MQQVETIRKMFFSDLYLFIFYIVSGFYNFKHCVFNASRYTFCNKQFFFSKLSKNWVEKFVAFVSYGNPISIKLTKLLAWWRTGYPIFSSRQKHVWAIKKRLTGKTLDREHTGRAMWAVKWPDPDHVSVWIHEAAVYHTLQTSGAERRKSDNVAHWL